MFTRLVTHKRLRTKTILFDCWYASVENLKLIQRSGWTFFTTLKSNRKVSVSRDIGYQHLQELAFQGADLVEGMPVKLKGMPLMVKLFKIAAPDGDIDWVITNDLAIPWTCSWPGSKTTTGGRSRISTGASSS